ncbi:MAG TPA: exodeoxyribonuclease VII small subunit [Pirellulaceae bacterium]|nr:exodeoxyribonuclease VII small subunit [Pirellulaceae bacterium]
MSATEEGPTFEQSLLRLEQLVRELEDGSLGLSDSLARYEEGIRCLKQCQQALERAERKVELLTGVDADGNPVTQPFDEQDMTLEEKAQSRSQRRSKSKSSSKSPRASESEANESDDQSGLLF